MLYDAADCLARLRREIGQPSTSDFPTDTDCYAWLGEAQIEVFAQLAVYAPQAVRQPPRQLTQPVVRTVASCVTVLASNNITAPAGSFTAADQDAAISGAGIPVGAYITGVLSATSINISAVATANGTVTTTITPDPGYIFTFGYDADGNALYPVGAVQLFYDQTCNPDSPLQENVDFLMEGNKIRMPDNTPWSGPIPYFQSLLLPLTLSATVPPVLRPVQSRCLIVDAACVRYCEDTSTDAAIFQKRYERHWTQNIAMIQTQYAAPFRTAATNPNAYPARSRFSFGARRWFGRP